MNVSEFEANELFKHEASIRQSHRACSWRASFFSISNICLSGENEAEKRRDSFHPELPTKMQGRKRARIKFKLVAQSKDITKLKEVSREISQHLAIGKAANKMLSQENGSFEDEEI